jgi:hypothetical protein
VTRTVAQEAIARLEEGGVLLKTGDGKKGSPFRYWRHRVEIHSAGTPPLSRGRMNSSTIGADSGLFENGDRPEEHEMLSAATPVVAAE